MNAFSIDPDEQIDDLFLKNYKIIQKQGCFRYGTDAVVLSDFAAKYIKKGSRLLDVGTGTGILPLLLSAKTEAAELVGLEIQEEMVRLAGRSVHLNEQSGALKQGRVRIVEGDIRNAKEYFPPRSFDVVVTIIPSGSPTRWKRCAPAVWSPKSCNLYTPIFRPAQFFSSCAPFCSAGKTW